MLSLAQINAASVAEFVVLLDGTYEHSPWVAQSAAAQRPFASLAALKHALASAVRQSGRETQLKLICAHPELAGKAMLSKSLTAESTHEQGRAGLTDCTPQEFARIQQLNAAYNAKFGWPFILAVRGPRGVGLTRAEIIATFERRLAGHADFEFAECLRNIHRIAEIRLNDKFGATPVWGQRVWDWAEALAQHSDPGYAEQGQLTVTYLTPSHQAVARRLQGWMQEAGFDEVGIDAVGNVVGVYHGSNPAAPRLLTGSHYDTVRNGGKYDGRLGILVPMAVVQQLHAQAGVCPLASRWWPLRKKKASATRPPSWAVARSPADFDPAGWTRPTPMACPCATPCARRPARHAARHPGAASRDAARYLGFVEVHIEQGPVLDELDLPLGIVTSINGSRRYLGEVIGQASHAGTTPMDRRRDAACAVAELTLFVEKRAGAVPDVVGTVGQLQVPAGSINVVPGRCQFSLDLRATTNEARDTLASDVRDELARICAERGLSFTLEETLAASAAPSHPAWQRRWEQAVQALGLPVHCLPSGAGHDAMKLHEKLPQAMLFVRGGNAGISHNPLESITTDDAELCVAAFQHLLQGLAAE
jgi:N-carbamoyl-L-amino-acid hydrolase